MPLQGMQQKPMQPGGQPQAMQQQAHQSGGSLLYRLYYMTEYRNRFRPADNNIAWFRDYVADFFTRSSVTRILSKDPPATQQLHPPHQTLAGPSEPKVLEIPYESLPRLLQLKYEHGLQEEHFLVKNAVEAPVPGGGISITCFPAFEQLVFGGYTMVNKGRLMVLFSPSLKVQLMEFTIVKRDVQLDHAALQPSLAQAALMVEEKRALLMQALQQSQQPANQLAQHAAQQAEAGQGQALQQSQQPAQQLEQQGAQQEGMKQSQQPAPQPEQQSAQQGGPQEQPGEGGATAGGSAQGSPAPNPSPGAVQQQTGVVPTHLQQEQPAEEQAQGAAQQQQVTQPTTQQPSPQQQQHKQSSVPGAGAMDAQQLNEILLATSSALGNVQAKMEQWQKGMATYSNHLSHVMHMADVIGTMDELFTACNTFNLTPTAALESCGQRAAQLHMFMQSKAAAMTGPGAGQEGPQAGQQQQAALDHAADGSSMHMPNVSANVQSAFAMMDTNGRLPSFQGVEGPGV